MTRAPSVAGFRLLSKSVDEIKNIAMQTMEGHLRAILGTMAVEEIYQNRDAFAQKVQRDHRQWGEVIRATGFTLEQ